MEDNNIDKIFKKGLGKRQIKPTSDMWSQINGQLDKPKAIIVFKSWKFVAAAGLLLIVSTLWLMNKDGSNFSEGETMVNVQPQAEPTITKVDDQASQVTVSDQNSYGNPSPGTPKKDAEITKKIKSFAITAESSKAELIPFDNGSITKSESSEPSMETVSLGEEVDLIDPPAPNIKLKKLRKSTIKVPDIQKILNDAPTNEGNRLDNIIASVSDFASPIVHSIAEQNFTNVTDNH